MAFPPFLPCPTPTTNTLELLALEIALNPRKVLLWLDSVRLLKRLLKSCRQFHLWLLEDSGLACIQKLIKYTVTLVSVSQNYHFISCRGADTNNSCFLSWCTCKLIIHQASLGNRHTHLLCLACPFLVAHQVQIYWQVAFIWHCAILWYFLIQMFL